MEYTFQIDETNKWTCIVTKLKLQIKIIIFSESEQGILKDNSWKIYIETGILICI